MNFEAIVSQSKRFFVDNDHIPFPLVLLKKSIRREVAFSLSTQALHGSFLIDIASYNGLNILARSMNQAHDR